MVVASRKRGLPFRLKVSSPPANQLEDSADILGDVLTPIGADAAGAVFALNSESSANPMLD
jgi:hypothetical protein